MSYIGNSPISAAFLTDTFSGTGSQTAYTMTVAPANTSSILVSITGVVQDPSTYSVSGTTLTFSAAPPSGTSNISVRYLGIPASGVTTTAYRTVTNFTATASQTSFSVASYTVGYVDVYRNGVRLVSTDYTATTGTTVVLSDACTVGDAVVVESFYVSSVLNAIAGSGGSVSSTFLDVGNQNGTGALQAPAGTTAQRPSAPTVGMVRYNSSYGFQEVYKGSSWSALGGPSFVVYQSASAYGQSLPASAFTTLIMDTEVLDPNGCFNNTGSTVTLNGLSTPAYSFCPNVPGYYQFNCQMRIGANSNNVICVGAIKNNSGTTAGYNMLGQVMGNGVNGTGVQMSTIYYLNGTGDYVQSQAWINGGSTCNTSNLNNAGDTNWFTGSFIRGA